MIIFSYISDPSISRLLDLVGLYLDHNQQKEEQLVYIYIRIISDILYLGENEIKVEKLENLTNMYYTDRGDTIIIDNELRPLKVKNVKILRL